MYIYSATLILSLVPAVFAAPSAAAITPASAACPANPTVTETLYQTEVSTTTATSLSGSTSYVFLPGNSPAATPVKAKKKRSNCKPASRSSSTLSTVTTITTEATTASSETTTISSDPCPLTSTITVTATAIATAVATTTIVQAPVKTVYPCATPITSFQGPTYGDAAYSSNLGLSNSIFYLNSPQGASPAACCNACFFGSQNCVQAYWYAYQGCVVSTATAPGIGSGMGVTGQCPAGTINGLTYGPDKAPAFRSTGNIAGPCGQAYTNFS